MEFREQIWCLATDSSPVSNKTPDQARPNYSSVAALLPRERRRRCKDSRTSRKLSVSHIYPRKKKKAAFSRKINTTEIDFYPFSLASVFSRLNQSRSKQIKAFRMLGCSKHLRKHSQIRKILQSYPTVCICKLCRSLTRVR